MPSTTASSRRSRPLGTVYLLHFDHPYQHARHYTGWTGRPPRPPRAARPRLRRPADERHQHRRDRVRPGPHHRRHPRHRAVHQELRRRCPLLPPVHCPAAQRPLGAGPRRPHPPLLPACPPWAAFHPASRQRKAGLTMAKNTSSRGNRAELYATRQSLRQHSTALRRGPPGGGALS